MSAGLVSTSSRALRPRLRIGASSPSGRRIGGREARTHGSAAREVSEAGPPTRAAAISTLVRFLVSRAREYQIGLGFTTDGRELGSKLTALRRNGLVAGETVFSAPTRQSRGLKRPRPEMFVPRAGLNRYRQAQGRRRRCGNNAASAFRARGKRDARPTWAVVPFQAGWAHSFE
jgi:hypothetical protein